MRNPLARIAPILAVSILSVAAYCSPVVRNLQLELGTQAVTGNGILLDLGYQAENSPITIRIGVRNKQSSRLQLDVFKFSENLDVRWVSTNDPKGLVTRSVLAPGEVRELEVRIMPSKDADFPYLAFFSAGKQVMTLGIGFTLAPKTFTVQTGGQYWSAYADKYASYELCTGPAPFLYHLDSGAVGLDAKTVGGDHGRNCNAWMHCNKERADDTDVCYGFEIQGHLKYASFFGSWDDEKDWVKVDVHLHARYNLAPSTPSLSAVKLRGPIK